MIEPNILNKTREEILPPSPKVSKETPIEDLATSNIQNRGLTPKTQVRPADETIINKEEKITAETKKMVDLVKKDSKKLELDKKFVCDSDAFNFLLPLIQEQLDKCKDFDTASFLRGYRGSDPHVWLSNQQILGNATDFMQLSAQNLADKKGLALEDAYKLLIGSLDAYDDKMTLEYISEKKAVVSTFVLRSAILLASQKSGLELQSWMVYTKSGKPDLKDIWPFLDNWKNWVPEAQAAMAKFSEVTITKASELAKEHPDFLLILLKGGFGAGKTRLASELMKETASGVVAPDLGKRVVRRSLETVSHSSAHIQGSQVSFKLFDELIRKLMGTVVYDSSLSRASDLSDYLEKSQTAQEKKKVIVYDVARHDMARTLAVLKRDVGGDDPRIPPDFIIHSAIQDKLNRVECMKVILNYEVKNGMESPEYYFMGANAKGWDSQETLLITPHHIEQKHTEMVERLALEGIEIEGDTVNLTLSREQLVEYFNTQFERPVRDILSGLSKQENKTFLQVFGKRVLIPDLSKVSIDDEISFYEALPTDIKDVISKSSWNQAFASLKQETKEQFFKSIQGRPALLKAKIKKVESHLNRLKNKKDHLASGSKGRINKVTLNTQIDAMEERIKNLKKQLEESKSLSYLDLPLRAALIIHQKLEADPWQ